MLYKKLLWISDSARLHTQQKSINLLIATDAGKSPSKAGYLSIILQTITSCSKDHLPNLEPHSLLWIATGNEPP